MRFTIGRTALLRAVSHVQRVVEKRTTIPILSNVLLVAAEGALRLKGTDLDLEVSEVIEADVSEEGSATVPAHVLHDIVRKLPEDAELTLELQGNGRVSLRSGRSRFELQSLPESDFPSLMVGTFDRSFVVKAGNLKSMIDKVSFAISTEETRYYLNGVYLHAAEGPAGSTLRMVATDGHRLAKVEAPAPEGAAGLMGVIVPRKAVGELQKLAEDAGADVLLEVSGTKLRATIGQVVLATKLIDGTFPDYERVIPANNDKELVVPRVKFSAAIDRVSTISTERGRAVKLTLEAGKAILSVTSPDAGSAVEEIDVDYDATPIELGFNTRYAVEVLAQIKGDEAVFRLADPGAPMRIEEREDVGVVYVLMPMRV